MRVIGYEWQHEGQHATAVGRRTAGTPASDRAKGSQRANHVTSAESGPRPLLPATASGTRNAPETTARATARESGREKAALDFSEKSGGPSGSRDSRAAYYEGIEAAVQDCDVAKLEHDGWRTLYGYEAPACPPNLPGRGVGWYHPDLGWVWARQAGRTRTDGTRSYRWFGLANGELGVGQRGPFRTVWGAVASLEQTGDAA